MNRVAQHPVKAFAAALAAVAVLSIMDAVMKGLVIAIGLVAVSVWRSLLNLAISAILYLPLRLKRPDRKTLLIHIGRGIVVMVMAALFFWGIGRVPLAQAIALTFIAPLIALVLAALFLGENDRPAVARRIADRLRRSNRDRARPGARQGRPRGADRKHRDHRLGALLRRQYRPDAPPGGRRQTARDQFLPERDGGDPVAGGGAAARAAALAGDAMAVDRRLHP